MAFNRTLLRSLFIERDHFILSNKQYKRILLTGRLCIIAFLISFGYLIFDLLNGVQLAWPYQLACSVLTLISFLLNRNGKFLAAKILLGLSTNLTVFIFAINEPFEVGLYMFFITYNLGALVVFGFEERGKAAGFILFSITLFLLSTFIHADFIRQSAYTA